MYADDKTAYTYNIAFNAVNNGRQNDYEDIKNAAVESGISESTFINNTLKAQNEYAEKTGQTVLSIDNLFNENA